MSPRTLCAAALLLSLPARGGIEEFQVTLSVKGESIRAVLTLLSQQTGTPIRVDERLSDQPVTIELKDRPLNQALDLVCRAGGLVWREAEGIVWVGLDPARRIALPDLGELPVIALALNPELLARPVTIGFLGVTVREVFASLAEASGVRFAVDPSVPGDLKVAATFRDTPLSRCLYLLCTASGLYVRPAARDTLAVLPPVRVAVSRDDGQPPRVIEVYPDDYRGALGYLLTDEFWQNPARYGDRVEVDARGQPKVVPLWPQGAAPTPAPLAPTRP